MADKEPRQPTHRAYSVIRREGQDDYWLNIGLVFPHKDGSGFNIMLQAFPLDGKIVCREIAEGEEPTDTVTPLRSPQSKPASRTKAASAADQQPQRAPRMSPGLASFGRAHAVVRARRWHAIVAPI